MNHHDELRVASIFGDHMVLQRDQALPIWGRASPGAEVSVRFRDHLARATTDASGSWRVELPPQSVGPAAQLAVSCGESTLSFGDVLVGELWICAGQSNMQWSVERANHPTEAIAAADIPSIRLFDVARTYSIAPEQNVSGRWVRCSPDSVAEFSAVAYYFGQKLWQELELPVGLIASSWGGTPAEAWTPKKTLLTRPDYTAIIAAHEDAVSRLPEEWAKDERSRAGSVMLNSRLETGSEERPVPEAFWFDPDWSTAALSPVLHGEPLLKAADGLAYVRRVFTLTEAEAALGAAQLKLGQIDKFDATWINGTLIGETGPPGISPRRKFRKYTIPAETLLPGKNVLLLQFADVGETVHFGNNIDQPEIVWPNGARHALNGTFNSELKDVGAFLWNGMIAPLHPLAFRGVIWYQGESNTDRAEQYRRLFPDLITAWRDAWDRGDFPFYFVQLANFSGCDGWPELREAQRETLALPETGMAVTIDIGDPDDLHPKNKQDVGHRLALWALANTYGQTEAGGAGPLPHSGPLFARAEKEPGRIRLHFEHVYNGLCSADGGPLTGFTIADQDGAFRPAEAAIDGATVAVSHPEVSLPSAVRYAWHINPKANLSNSTGLPASPFRTDRGPLAPVNNPNS